MTIVQRILREKILLGSLGTAVVGLLVLLGVDPTLMGSIALVVAALIALIRAVVTPTGEVLVQQKPGEAPKITTDKFGLEPGAQAWIQQADPAARVPLAEDRPPEERGERGAADVLLALVITLLSLITGIGLFAGWEVMVALLALVGAAYLAVRWYRNRRPSPSALVATLRDLSRRQVSSEVGGVAGR